MDTLTTKGGKTRLTPLSIRVNNASKDAVCQTMGKLVAYEINPAVFCHGSGSN